MHFKGTRRDDTLFGTEDKDVFRLTQGGHDTADGRDGRDNFVMGAALDTSDSLIGGAGFDTVKLNGNYYSSPLTLGPTTLIGIERLTFAAGHSYVLMADDGNVAAGATLTVESRGGRVEFDGSAETDGRFHFIAGVEYDRFIGGEGNDIFELRVGSAGITDTVAGRSGDDTFILADLSDPPTVDGEDGTDIVVLDDDFGAFDPPHGIFDFRTLEFTLVERVSAVRSHDYFVNLSVNMNSSNDFVIVDTTDLLADDISVFGANFAPGWFEFVGGDAHDNFNGGDRNDVLSGANNDDFLAGRNGSDTLTGGAGRDIFYYYFANDSRSATHDTITDFDADTDDIDLSQTVTSYDGQFSGTVNAASFDADLVGVAAGHFSGSPSGVHALTIAATAGTLAGHVFLVIDGNANGAYDGGSDSPDYVIDITGYTGTLDTGDFI